MIHIKGYTKDEAIKEMLRFREKWDNDLIDYDDYQTCVMHVLRYTKEEEK